MIKQIVFVTVIIVVYLLLVRLIYPTENNKSTDMRPSGTNKNVETIEVIEVVAEPKATVPPSIIKKSENECVELQNIKLKTWTDEDLEMMACVIYQEAGADYISDETRLMVGCVVMNRVDHELYPSTIHEVLTQKKQYGRFHWTGVVWPERAKDSIEANAVQRSYDIAERVLNGERVLESGYIFQSEFKQSNDYIYQDGFYFCRYNGSK